MRGPGESWSDVILRLAKGDVIMATMTVYKSCKVSDVQRVIMGGDDGDGYAFSILSGNNRPLVALSFATRKDAEEARAKVASAVEKAVEVMPQS